MGEGGGEEGNMEILFFFFQPLQELRVLPGVMEGVGSGAGCDKVQGTRTWK